MKKAYPVILSRGEKFIVAYVPDFEINTQGTDAADAIEMARDAIGVVSIDIHVCHLLYCFHSIHG